jgi:tRNA (mo5U34)-methyltransferase
VNELTWFHTIDLGEGKVTPGKDNSPERLARIRMPESLAGRTVLDVGAYDGFFSFEAERRGASRVLATDSFMWGGHRDRKPAFDYARERLGSRVEDQVVDVLDLSPETVGGPFDVVLFLGVLYHMRHPLLALERIASVTGELLILETETAHLATRAPAVRYFLEGNDWCAPNEAAIRSMLADVGFRRVERVHRYSAPYRLARAARWKAREERPFWSSQSRGRAAFHAWR